MLSKLLCGAVLASAAAGAAAQTWNFTYTGLQPSSTIYGSFSGSDHNGDGVLSAAELTSLIIHSAKVYGTDFTGCAQHSDFVFSCSLDAFSFDPKGNLAFTVNWVGNSSEVTHTGHIVSGVEQLETSSSAGTFLYTEKWVWTNDTKLVISPPPVPEPSPAAMSLAGLLALGLARLPLTRRPRARQT
jgi:hypothetical protein